MSTSGVRPIEPVISQPSSPSTRQPLFTRRVRDAALAYVFIIPSFIIIVAFGLYPVLRAAFISLHRWSIIKERFIGLENYVTLLQDPDFWQALQVTVFYVVATVPLTMMLSLLIAYLLFRPIRYRSLFRTLYFLPYVTSMVPAAMVWQWIFNAQSGVLNFASGGTAKGVAAFLQVAARPPGVYIWLGLMAAWLIYLLVTSRRRSGWITGVLAVVAGGLLGIGVLFLSSPTVLEWVVNELQTFFPLRWLQEPRGIFLYLGKRWGFKPPSWLQGPSMSLLAVSIVSMWHFTGYDVVIYLAGLFNVPPELYEAARMDGATESQLFWKITFPMLSPTSFFLLIISTIGAFRSFTMFFVLTRGGPLKTTTSVTYYIYDRFYNATQWGYASAIAFVLFGIILAMTLLNQRLAGRRVFYQ